ncbi:MAG: ABC transporter permease [Actinomycetota bacterium]
MSFLRKLGLGAVVVVLATFFLSWLMRQIPGSAVDFIAPFASEQQRTEISRALGLDKGLLSAYWDWLSGFVRGDFGDFLLTSGSIGTQLGEVIPVSLLLMVYVQLVALGIGVPLGLYTAYRANSRTDAYTRATLFSLSSIPNFGTGIILAILVGVKLNLVPPAGYVYISESIGGHFQSMLLPVIALAIAPLTSYTNLMRSEVLATLREDYITLAASKGLRPRRILFRHVIRPSITPIMTSAALSMSALIGGALVIEIIFVIPGLGTLLQRSIFTKEYGALQTIVAVIAVFYIVFNTIVDALINIVDPRTRGTRAAR